MSAQRFTCPLCGRSFRTWKHIERVASSLRSRGFIVELNGTRARYASPLLPGRIFTTLHGALAALAEAGVVGAEACYHRARAACDHRVEAKLRALLSRERGRVATIPLKELLGRKKVLHSSFYTPERLAELLPRELDGWRLEKVEKGNGAWRAVYRR